MSKKLSISIGIIIFVSVIVGIMGVLAIVPSDVAVSYAITSLAILGAIGSGTVLKMNFSEKLDMKVKSLLIVSMVLLIAFAGVMIYSVIL